MNNILRASRYLIMVAVVGAYAVAAILIVYGGVLLVNILIDIFLTHPHFNANADRRLMLECIQEIDIFLLGTAFYIVSFGLYELFINRHAKTPNWLSVHSLEDLKAKLLGVVIVILSVYFLEQVINWDGKRDILSLGVAEALVIAAIVLTIKFQEHHSPVSTHTETTYPSSPEVDEESTDSGPLPGQEGD